uniref:E3 ubiquitin-protein ligase RNF4 n=1 Tax=Macaca nemestrina TaxID=9545 RepID=A0A2K6CHC2_MACNE
IKRRGGAINSRQTQKGTREISLEAEPIELVETGKIARDTQLMGMLKWERVAHCTRVKRRRPRRNARRLPQDHADSCVVSSDDEELSRDRDVYVTTHTPRNTRDEGATGLRPSGTVSCPICMDGYSEIVQNGRLIVSTECGHVFCSQCLRDSLKNANTCPTCRKKINHKRYHPIYI